METIQQITFKDITLHIYGKYYEAEGQTYDYPGAPSSFETSKITLEDSEINIFDLFGWDDLEKIGELVIEKIEE